ncbi:FecR family protein [Mucilaginibacter lappiensis]|uniref:FecR family protein n=1 Tax=Mucilaginibacter lappiensis TaxID=354630 RepID=UPI003D263F0E
MKEHLSIELLEKYINGNCTEAEVALVKQWYQSFEHDPDYTPTLSTSGQKELEEKIYNSIINNIDVVNDEETPVKTSGIRRLHTWQWVSGVAAVLLVAITIGTYQKVQVNKKLSADAEQLQIVAITNNSNRIYKSILPDSSSVWLSPHAQLRYPKVFAASSRVVFMSGECFFEVTKNPKRPFIINSRSIITKVWGTSFRIRDNDQSSEADVSVVTGKVSVSIKTKQNINNASLSIAKGDVMLYPHQKVVYSTNDHTLKPESTADEPALKIWNRVDLLFDNKLLKDIIPVLNSKYHVHIVAANEKLNHYMLNADFSGFNLPDVLEALNKSLNIDYEIKNNTIELK